MLEPQRIRGVPDDAYGIALNRATAKSSHDLADALCLKMFSLLAEDWLASRQEWRWLKPVAASG
jgi:hypothetical protein